MSDVRRRWRIDWTTYKTGFEVIEADSEDEARRKFHSIPYENLVLPSPWDYAEIERVVQLEKNERGRL